MGGGLGDIEEVLAAGRRLARAGFPIVLYRRRGRPLPKSVNGPWAWPKHARKTRIVRRAPAALTIAPSWGISAAPSRPVRFGRGGPWEEEATDVEAVYGSSRTIHVSLEEFARTLTSVEETRERLREGGVAARALAARLRAARRSGDLAGFRAAFRTFRAFDRPNVLHLFATFRPDPAFTREFPEAVQTGPLWPRRYRKARRTRSSSGNREWVWYASPASAPALAPAVAAALRTVRPPVHLYVRALRPWALSPSVGRIRVATDAVASASWRRRFVAAELRIVTGSRTLLEAIEVGGPFLYFNGLLGSGRHRRRHRPEKIVALVKLGRQAGVPKPLLRDLSDFSRGRRVAAVVARAARRSDGWAPFPRFRPVGFRSLYDDAGSLLVAVARALARAPNEAVAIVARVRARSNP